MKTTEHGCVRLYLALFVLLCLCVFGLREVAKAENAVSNDVLMGNVILKGTVYSLRAEPIEGALVEIAGRCVATDANGRFVLTGLSESHEYSFVVFADGYHELTGQIDAHKIDLCNLQLFMDPLNNLVRNGAFEDSEGGGPGSNQRGIGRYWEVICGGEHPEIYSLDKEIYHSGGTSQRMSCEGYLIDWSTGENCYSLGENGERIFHPVGMRLGSQAVAQMTDVSSIEPGKIYELTAWVKSDGLHVSWQWLRLELYWMSNSGKVVRVVSQENTGHEPTHDWKLIKIRAVAPEKPKTVSEMKGWTPPQRAKIYLHHHFEQGTIWFDNVCLVQVD